MGFVLAIKRFFYILPFTFGLAGLFLLAQAAKPMLAANAGTIKASKLTCTVRSQGKMTVYLAKDSAIWELEHTKLTYYMLPPSYELLVYNRSHNIGRPLKKELWMSHLDSRTPVIVLRSNRSTTVFRGRPATLIKLDIKPVDDFREQSEFFYQDNQKRYNEFSKMEIIESLDIKLSPAQLQFIKYKHGMSCLTGLPLRITHIYPNNKRQVVFEIDKMETVNMPVTAWQLPKNYKKVYKTSQVSMEQERYKEAADMFDTLILTKP